MRLNISSLRTLQKEENNLLFVGNILIGWVNYLEMINKFVIIGDSFGLWFPEWEEIHNYPDRIVSCYELRRKLSDQDIKKNIIAMSDIFYLLGRHIKAEKTLAERNFFYVLDKDDNLRLVNLLLRQSGDWCFFSQNINTCSHPPSSRLFYLYQD